MQYSERGTAKLQCPVEHRIEDRGEVAGRGIDDLQYFGGRGLLLQSLARLGQEPRILHRDDRLRREILQQCDLLVSEGHNLVTEGRDRAKKHVILAQGHNQKSPNTALDGDPQPWVVWALSGQLPNIVYLYERLALDHPGKRVAPAGEKPVTHQFVKLLRRRVMGRRRPEAGAVISE